MSDFTLYLQLGFYHIADLNAYDHIVFLVALLATFKLSQWKPLLWLITAFTVGHSISLALATIKIVTVNSSIIEFLIPVTILITSIQNLFTRKRIYASGGNNIGMKYAIVVFFGLIHGLGFSNYLQTILSRESSIVIPLLSFNLGLEFGQILIVAVIFGILFLVEQLIKIKHRDWVIFLSGITFGISLLLMSETVFW